VRTCAICGAADNPLGKLRFKKNRVDGKIYCARCDPELQEAAASAAPPSVRAVETSAGSLIVIPCPTCCGMSHRPHGKPCESCVGYGSVRVPANNLAVFNFPKETGPEILTED